MLKVKAKFIYLLIFLIFIFSLLFFKENILIQIGDLLLFSEEPERADVIVILRGGLFERTVQAAELYKQGFGNKILVPMSLKDNISKQFRELNVVLPAEQEQVKSILEQLDIPVKRIILSTYNPGGGTVGEAYRVKKDLLKLGIEKFIVVTIWYHTKRVHNVYTKVFNDTNMKFWIVASKYGKSNPENWWHYRYISRAIIFEIPRLILSYFIPTFNLSFHDDHEKSLQIKTW